MLTSTRTQKGQNIKESRGAVIRVWPLGQQPTKHCGARRSRSSNFGAMDKLCHGVRRFWATVNYQTTRVRESRKIFWAMVQTRPAGFGSMVQTTFREWRFGAMVKSTKHCGVKESQRGRFGPMVSNIPNKYVFNFLIPVQPLGIS